MVEERRGRSEHTSLLLPLQLHVCLLCSSTPDQSTPLQTLVQHESSTRMHTQTWHSLACSLAPSLTLTPGAQGALSA